MICNEISRRTSCDPLCQVAVPQMLLEGVHMEHNLLPASRESAGQKRKEPAKPTRSTVHQPVLQGTSIKKK